MSKLPWIVLIVLCLIIASSFLIPLFQSSEHQELNATLDHWNTSVKSFSETDRSVDEFGEFVIYQVNSTDGRKFTVSFRKGKAITVRED